MAAAAARHPSTDAATCRASAPASPREPGLPCRAERGERFRYDPLKRLTCAYFSAAEDDAAPCALAYGYDPSGNGNLTSKSDVGALVYGDSSHPHAVTGAGSDVFGYDAVGNQTARPGGATVRYTPFDLPKTITQGTGTVTLDYDGDEQRIRKTTPEAETIYFAGLYERVTSTASAPVHRFYVHSSERVIAVVTQGGAQAGTVYVHSDHLGSVDALTDASGTVIERRSYDPFGQRRNPVWGQPVPASFPVATTLGFTGHESDDELGLVNMKGRMYDPRVGRFLTMDPLVQEPLSGQSWNPYNYVANNPLNFVDPSGFEYGPGQSAPPPDPEMQKLLQGGCLGLECQRPQAPPSTPVEGPREAAQNGAATRPVDVSTTGSTSGHVPQPVATEPTDWLQHPFVQLGGGFVGGVALGLVPFGGVGQQLLDAAEALPHGTPEARLGLAFGQIVGGFIGLVGGLTGEIGGGIASTTGVGAAVGVPVIVVSTAVVVGSVGNMAAGIRGLMTTGSGSGSNAQGSRRPSPAQRERVFEKSKDPGGTPRCEYCDREITKEPGKPESFEADHKKPWSRGGPTTDENLTGACRTCNRSKGAKMPEEFQP
jgi:RHS repeat-associated protein